MVVQKRGNVMAMIKDAAKRPITRKEEASLKACYSEKTHGLHGLWIARLVLTVEKERAVATETRKRIRLLRDAVQDTPCRCRCMDADGALRKSWKLCGSCEARSQVRKALSND